MPQHLCEAMRRTALCLLCCLALPAQGAAQTREGARPNIIFILTDDQRYDELGFLNPVIETPHMDSLAETGVHFQNAFVTTSLCSPSRASILTGQYMHNHGVVDNNKPPRPGTIYFPQYLQEAGYRTAFIGKWHMGGHRDSPQPGFDHWVSFAGQGHYYPVRTPDGSVNQLNVNGRRVPQQGYITDELTDYALDWLAGLDREKPFFMYLSHKAVHANFAPAERHKDQYAEKRIPVPASQADTLENYKGKPMWVRNQRNSWHGVDFPYHSLLNVQEYKRLYHRALSAVDESLGKLLDWLQQNGLRNNTLVIFMGDNGFLFGEHGLIDKRNAYEESMRVPLLMSAPGLISRGRTVKQVAANIDIASTVLDAAGLPSAEQFDGQSLMPLARGKRVRGWRDHLLYEYYWEFNYPHTPTTFALRTGRFKLIQYHGVWDTEELYDLKNDPKEMNNLIEDPKHLQRKVEMRRKLFELLANRAGAHVIPYTEKFNSGAVFRNRSRSRAAEFPDKWLREAGEADLRIHLLPGEKGAK